MAPPRQQWRRQGTLPRRLAGAAVAAVACLSAASAFVSAGSASRRWSFSPRGSAVGSPRTARASAETRLYDVLGISKDASVSEIKKAYYKEAKEAHPDKHPGDDDMLERFQEVADAYQTLADPVRRQKYDLQGLAGLAFMETNATRLFGPPPWRVLIGKTVHWLWEEGKEESMLGLLVASIPNGIAGVTIKTLTGAYHEAMETDVAVLLERVSENQAKDTVEALEEYGIAVKAEPLEGEREKEQESPLMYFRRIQRELGEVSEQLRQAAINMDPRSMDLSGDDDEEFNTAIDTVRSLRSELRAAAKELEEFKLEKTQKLQQDKEQKLQEEREEAKEEEKEKEPQLAEQDA